MVRRMGLVVAAVSVLSATMVGCGSKPLVGVLLPISGIAATYGESIESGIRLALSDARERNAVPAKFDVVWADSGSDSDRAVSELRRLVTERGVHLVIGGATSAEARALIPLLEELDVVCLSPSASAPGLGEQSRMFFRIYPSDELEGYTAAKFLVDRLDKPTIVLYVGNAEYARGIEPEFRKEFEEALRGRIEARVDLADPDWEAQSATALRSPTDPGLYIIGYANEILDVLRHLDRQGFEGRIVTTSAFYAGAVMREAADLAEGILFPLPPFDRTSEKEPVLSFVNRYMETYQRAPDVFAAHGYDAMRLAIEVMRIASPPQTTEIRRALQFGVSEFMGVTGPILFDEAGDVKHYPKMFVLKDGQVLSYQRYLKAERARILRKVQDLLVDQD
jgi:branched-chain amino acid transport system substrate-binding protein